MKGLILTVLFTAIAALAFAGEPPPLLIANPEPGSPFGGGGHKSSDAILVDKLVTAARQVKNGLSGCAYPAHDSWVAFDYTPSSAVTVRQVTLDYLYKEVRLKNTLHFRLYSGGYFLTQGSVVSSWSVPASGYEEKDTYWIAFGRVLYRAIIPIPAQSLSGSTKYWFAYRSANTTSENVVYWAVHESIEEEEVWWHLRGSWGPSSIMGSGGEYEQSYRLEDAVNIGVEPASLGKVKALFN